VMHNRARLQGTAATDKLLVDNFIDRYKIGTDTKGLETSARRFISRDRPTGENASNWLPAPDGLFSVFAPVPTVRSGSERNLKTTQNVAYGIGRGSQVEAKSLRKTGREAEPMRAGQPIGLGGSDRRRQIANLHLAALFALIPPKILESIWRMLGIPHGVLDIFVPHPCLNSPRVMPRIGQRITAAMAQHVRMNWESHPGALA
jgi:hypothetical protein